jgi:cytochrome c
MKALLSLVTAMMVLAPAMAKEPQASKDLCLTCHEVNRKIIGPAFADIARKYAGDRSAADRLSERIRKGSQGIWGDVRMPANPQLSAEEAHQLASWVLSFR